MKAAFGPFFFNLTPTLSKGEGDAMERFTVIWLSFGFLVVFYLIGLFWFFSSLIFLVFLVMGLNADDAD